MRVIFVRHGHPNYEIDCLTDLGKLQAQAVTQRLKDEKIAEFYASTCGRAMETAQWIARDREMEVHPLNFMREIGWGSTNEEYALPFKGHPWDTAVEMVAKNELLLNPNWMEDEPFRHNDKCIANYHLIAENIDEWLKNLGYQREGDYYRVLRENHDTVLLASHGGASGVVLSHLLNLPFPYVAKTFYIDFTSVTILAFHGPQGKLISPDVECMNDARHIRGITVENFYGN